MPEKYIDMILSGREFFLLLIIKGQVEHLCNELTLRMRLINGVLYIETPGATFVRNKRQS